MESKQQFKI